QRERPVVTRMEVENDVEDCVGIVVDDLDYVIRNSERAFQQLFQLPEALIERADLRQRVRSGCNRVLELTEKIETGVEEQLIHALADQRQFLVQGRIKTRLTVCQDVLGVGESVPRNFDGVDKAQRDQVKDLPFSIERKIGRHLRRRIAVDAQQPQNLPL